MMRLWGTCCILGMLAVGALLSGPLLFSGLRPAQAQQLTGSVAPVSTPSAAASLILKKSAGNLYSVYATNLTATAGFMVVLNATSVPADGAIVPLGCVPLPASGAASINYIPTPAGLYNVGIVAALTSASTCFTLTTGVITGFIAGTVQ